jgi:hypothetical protein
LTSVEEEYASSPDVWQWNSWEFPRCIRASALVPSRRRISTDELAISVPGDLEGAGPEGYAAEENEQSLFCRGESESDLVRKKRGDSGSHEETPGPDDGDPKPELKRLRQPLACPANFT